MSFGPLAQLVERLICIEEVTGSSPVRSTTIEFSGESPIFSCAAANAAHSFWGNAEIFLAESEKIERKTGDFFGECFFGG